MIKVKPELCDLCAECVLECPYDAIMVLDGEIVVSAEDCVDCSSCVDACENQAIEKQK